MRRYTMLAPALTLLFFAASLPYGESWSPIKVVGDRVYHPSSPEDYVQTYVVLPYDHTSATPPLAVGVELTSGFVNRAPQLPQHIALDIPTGPDTTFHYVAYEQLATAFPMVGKNPFTFLYWSYTFNGHPAEGIYDKPHFDLHFMFPSAEYWWGQEWTPDSHGPCFGGNNATFFKTFKPVSASCWPGDVSGPVLQIGDFVWGMGSHLLDMSMPEFNPPRPFNFTQIYGQYDGEIRYFEAMIAVATMQRRNGYKECITLKNNPKAVPVPRLLPRQLCLERKARSFLVEYRDFAEVAVGCSPAAGVTPLYGGTFPAIALPPPQCTVPPLP